LIDSKKKTSLLFSYSGADIAVVCREALLRPIRRLGSATHFKQVDFDCFRLQTRIRSYFI